MTLAELQAVLRELDLDPADLLDAGNRMATEIEQRWSGSQGCDCSVCSAAKAWRELTGRTT